MSKDNTAGGVTLPPKGLRNEQEDQFADWTERVTSAIEKYGQQLGDLDARTRRMVEDDAKALAKMDERCVSLEDRLNRRLRAMDEHWRARGGDGEGVAKRYGSRFAREMGRYLGDVLSFGEAVAAEKLEGRVKADDEWLRAAVDVGTGPSGGFLVVQQLIAEMIRNVEQYGVFEAVRLIVG